MSGYSSPFRTGPCVRSVRDVKRTTPDLRRDRRRDTTSRAGGDMRRQ